MKLLSLTSYLSLIWGLLVSFCLAPGESLAQTATQYSRVVAQAERIAYLAAQRSALAGQVASAAVAPSAASVAVRMVAGPVGWAALGVGAGLVLAQMYYSQSDLSAIKSAASTPGGWQVTSSNAGIQTFPGLGTSTPANANYLNASIQFSTTNVPLCAVDVAGDCAALRLLRQSARRLQSMGLVLHCAPDIGHCGGFHCGVPHHLCGRPDQLMTAILTLIYCWLQEFFFSLTDWGLSIWDSLLSAADSTLATVGTAGLTLPVIPDQYAWVLGATGMSQALAILASAMGTRFILQTIPFVRWGS